jgi:DNA-binding CsgD family transcriptional regulator
MDGDLPAALDAVIANAYAAVHEPDRWPAVVASYAAVLQAPMAGLLAPPIRDATPRLFVLHNVDVGPVMDKVHLYGRQAPFAERAIAMGLAPGVFLHDEVIPPEEFHETDYYREYQRPTGVEHGLQAILRASTNEPGGPVSLTVGRRAQEEPFGETEKRLARLAFPHLRRAVGLALDLNPARALDLSVRDALDGFDTACCLLGEDARLVFANATARDLLRSGAAILARRDRIRSPDATADAALHRATAKACDIHRNWSGRAGSEVILPSPDDEALVAVIVPLGHENPFLNAGPLRAAVYLLDVAQRPATGRELERLRNLYGLTAAEAEVTAAIVGGRSVAEIADARGVSVHTVKTQLKLILEKTQSSRQMDLSRLQRLLAVRRPS